MKKQFKQIEDFLEDPSFREWVLSEGRHRNLYWETWCRQHPKNCSILHEARQVLLAMESHEEEWQPADQDRVFAKINQIIDRGQEELDEKTDSVNQITREDRHYQRPKEYGMLKVAAVLLVMLVGAAVSWEFGLIPTEKEVQEVRLDWISKTTRSGEKKRISLPDGSRVTLNASSEIRYDEGFGESHREIFLKGESFFEVEKDSLLPFRVHSGKLITEALGTAFNVYAFEEDAQVKVQLIEGRVSVEKENEGTSGNDLIYLSPGEEASLSDVDFTKTGFDMEKALLWTKGILYFDDVPFDQVVKTLERWYGVEITVTGNPGKLPRVSGEFNRDNLDNVMNSISYSFRFDYDIEGDKVNVRF